MQYTVKKKHLNILAFLKTLDEQAAPVLFHTHLSLHCISPNLFAAMDPSTMTITVTQAMIISFFCIFQCARNDK